MLGKLAVRHWLAIRRISVACLTQGKLRWQAFGAILGQVGAASSLQAGFSRCWVPGGARDMYRDSRVTRQSSESGPLGASALISAEKSDPSIPALHMVLGSHAKREREREREGGREGGREGERSEQERQRQRQRQRARE